VSAVTLRSVQDRLVYDNVRALGATYGFGIVSSLEADAPRELVVSVLQRIAAFAGAPIRDVFEDEVIEVWPNGDVKQLEASSPNRLPASSIGVAAAATARSSTSKASTSLCPETSKERS
jgi:hypothetical protein